MIGRNDICWCGSGKKWKKCHYPKTNGIIDPFQQAKLYRKKYDILIKSDKEIEGIRRAGHLAAEILDELCAFAKEGVTTEQLNDLALKLHKEAGAIPATVGYGEPPFPKAICTSINEVICHGIPGERVLKDGDIMNIDVTSILNGYFGDCSQMVMIGDVSAERALVVDVAYQALMRSAAILKPGILVSDIAEAIEPYAASRGCSTVHQFVGHGVGLRFHEGPQIPHSINDYDIEIVAGMTFTIEPMINAGVPRAVIDKEDRWTAYTADRKPSAQWEHTFLITDNGYEILTPWKYGIKANR